MKTTLISHFFNEEFLLPYWLRHHVSMFDHAVLIDYASTDRSREIIRELAPHWEVRPSRNRLFDVVLVDEEVMQIEEEFDGWKMVLNTTEFLVHHDLRAFLSEFAEHFPAAMGVRTTGIVMVDRLEDRGHRLTDEPLVLQKQYGYFETGLNIQRRRLIHRAKNGRYQVGRHTNSLTTLVARELFLAWFGWCPIDHIKARKLAVQTKMPLADKLAGRGKQHLITQAQLEETYQKEAARCYCLPERSKDYRAALERLRGNYPDRQTVTSAMRPRSPFEQDSVESRFYHTFDDVVGLLLARRIKAERVLQLGPGEGECGETAHTLRAAVVAKYLVGVYETDERARRAKWAYDEVVVADLNRSGDVWPMETDFDLIVAAGVMQRVYDPWDALARLVRLLCPGGLVILQIPNAQNVNVLAKLSEGAWRYERQGLINPHQVRMFGRQDLLQLIAGAGLGLLEIVPTQRNPPFELETIRETGNSLTAGKMTMANLTREEVVSFLADQYIVVAQRPADAARPQARREVKETQWSKAWLSRPWTIRPVPGTSMIDVNGVKGFLVPGDVSTLFDLAGELPRGGHYLEVGSWEGLSSIIVAYGLIARRNLEATIHCVDTWRGSPEHQAMAEIQEDRLHARFLKNIADAGVQSFIQPIRGDSSDVARQWRGPPLDLIFIDGDHSEEGCSRDICAWMERLKPEGRMLGHDAVPGGEVDRAVKRYCSEHGARASVRAFPAAHFIWEIHRG